jgi:serine/threonine-protein kinase HipA
LKYEADGGPGVADISRVLQGSESRDDDLATLLQAQLLFWMLAATDGHAKNFSIRLLAQGRYRLTPLYDVLSGWPITGPRHNQLHLKKLKLAMAVRGTTKHVVARTPDVIETVGAGLPKGFPERLFDSMTTGLRKAARQIARMPPA